MVGRAGTEGSRGAGERPRGYNHGTRSPTGCRRRAEGRQEGWPLSSWLVQLPRVLLVVTRFIVMSTQRGRCSYPLDFTDEETEAQREQGTLPKARLASAGRGVRGLGADPLNAPTLHSRQQSQGHQERSKDRWKRCGVSRRGGVFPPEVKARPRVWTLSSCR